MTRDNTDETVAVFPWYFLMMNSVHGRRFMDYLKILASSPLVKNYQEEVTVAPKIKGITVYFEF